MTAFRLAAFELARFRTPLQRIALVFAVCVPLLYGALYLWSNWDPYNRLDSIPVAVVNADAPVVVEGRTVDAGGLFVDQLRADPIFDWRFVDAAEADRGVREGDYYFEIDVPEDFSADLASGASGTPRQASMSIVLNDANGYVVGKMAQTVQSELQNRIDAAAVAAYFESVFGNLDRLRAGITQAADGANALRDGAGQARDGASALADGLGSLQAGADRLATGAHQVADGDARIADAVVPLANRVADAIPDVATSAPDAANRAKDLATRAADAASTVAGGTDSVQASLTALAAANPGLADEPAFRAAQAAAGRAATATGDVATRAGQVRDVATTVANGAAALAADAPQLQARARQAAADVQALADGAAAVATGADQLRTGLGMGLDPAHLGGTLGLLALGTTTFIAVAHMLRVWLGGIASAVILVLLVLQLTTCGGIYPVETLPAPFRALHPVLPMSYLVDGLRVTLSGGSGAHLARDLLVLGGFLVVTLALMVLGTARRRRWSLPELKPELAL
ncbi:YhgE/Pip family protein [Pseudonocardia dioxanivorans]|uniref:YhgE/Pip family protein n=1 Tax=Pseudonocardia dioxanivorans TaxID=240495 RepID=UPI000CD29F74|nr:YhgE/Pip family protein [Pseudonocardia dioxanivorans]